MRLCPPLLLLVAASLCATPSSLAQAQSGAAARRGLPSDCTIRSTWRRSPSTARTRSRPDDLKLVVFTRTSSCRLILIAPLCKLSPSQLFIDRRRTTPGGTRRGHHQAARLLLAARLPRCDRWTPCSRPAKRGVAVAFRIVEGEPTRIGSLAVDAARAGAERSGARATPSWCTRASRSTSSRSTRRSTGCTTRSGTRATATCASTRPYRVPTHRTSCPCASTIDPRWLTRVGSVQFEGNRALSRCDAAPRRDAAAGHAVHARRGAREPAAALPVAGASRAPSSSRRPRATASRRITVAVAETPPRHVEATLGFNTIEFGQAASSCAHNALGGGRWLRLHAAVGNLLGEQLNGRGIFRRWCHRARSSMQTRSCSPTYQASLTLTQPWIGERAHVGGAHARSPAGAPSRRGGGRGRRRIARRRARHRAAVRRSASTTASSRRACRRARCTSAPATASATRRRSQALQRTQRLAPIGVSAWIDRSDDLEAARRAATRRWSTPSMRRASTGSTFAHNRISADASYYKPFGRDARRAYDDAKAPKVLALHVRAGMVRPLASDRDALGVSGAGRGHPASARALLRRRDAVGARLRRERARTARAPGATPRRCSPPAAPTRSIANGSCDPERRAERSSSSRARSAAAALIEGNVELRVPLRKVLDAAWRSSMARTSATAGSRRSATGKGAVTPGVGFRYRSPLGVLRLDFGLRPVGDGDAARGRRGAGWRRRRRASSGSRRRSRTRRFDPIPARWHAHRAAARGALRDGPGVLMAQPDPALRRLAPTSEAHAATRARRARARSRRRRGGADPARPVVVLVLATTPWGNERVRRLLVSQANGRITGRLDVGELRGNLLSGATLTDVRLVDSARHPLFTARRVRVRYALLPALRGQVVMRSLVLDTADVVLDKRPGAALELPVADAAERRARRTRRSTAHRRSSSEITMRTAASRSGARGARHDAARRSTRLGDRRGARRQRAQPHRARGRRLPARARLPRHRRPAARGAPRARRAADRRARSRRCRCSPSRIARRRSTCARSSGRSTRRRIRSGGAARACRCRARASSGDGTIRFQRMGFSLDLTGSPLSFADLRWLDPQAPSVGRRQRALRHAHPRRLDDASRSRTPTCTIAMRRSWDTRRSRASIRRARRASCSSTARISRVARLSTAIVHELAPTLKLPSRRHVERSRRRERTDARSAARRRRHVRRRSGGPQPRRRARRRGDGARADGARSRGAAPATAARDGLGRGRASAASAACSRGTPR